MYEASKGSNGTAKKISGKWQPCNDPHRTGIYYNGAVGEVVGCYERVRDCLLGDREDQMAMCWLQTQWQVRDIYDIAHEVLELEQGRNPYKNIST